MRLLSIIISLVESSSIEKVNCFESVLCNQRNKYFLLHLLIVFLHIAYVTTFFFKKKHFGYVSLSYISLRSVFQVTQVL